MVVAGSFGKTTVTSMIMHVLRGAGYSFDYLVGAGIPGFDNPVRLSDDAPMIVMEGDEYLASRSDPRPKFLLYHAHMVIITGIEWDHINVFPTFASYLNQFELLVKGLDKAADIVYNEEDEQVVSLVKAHTDDRSQYLHPFQTPSYRVRDGVFEVKLEGERAALQVIGKHNMANIAASWEACKWLGMEIGEFITHIRTFTGAKLRQEKVYEDAALTIIRDYAHAPAKVLATVDAVRERYKKKKITACLELHSFSSLNKAYLPYYKGAMKKADRRIVYVNPQAVEHRRMEQISQEEMLKAFGDPNMIYVTSREALKKALKEGKSDVLLMMSSGNFDGLPMSELAG
ncbi:MAG: peptidoglycan synthetase [Bacteroidetes bacterium]|nr:MAG: peptidoglycan synthetase [Bacteroidota bacterium]